MRIARPTVVRCDGCGRPAPAVRSGWAHLTIRPLGAEAIAGEAVDVCSPMCAARAVDLVLDRDICLEIASPG